jgi:predicted ATP-dependent endonuclease of OLD family
MPTIIKRIKLVNYRRFREYTINPNERFNILVGDNEVGKSSVLEAIDLVSSGNIRRVESIGIDRLLSKEAVNDFQSGDNAFDKLPYIHVELYLEGVFDHEMNGKNNTDGIMADGIRLVCKPNEDYQNAIMESMKVSDSYFPYDYYSIRFSTFADYSFTGYQKKIRSIFIDSSSMNSDYAMNDYIKRMYYAYTGNGHEKERANHRSKYRQLKDSFRSDSLQELNTMIPNEEYAFGLRSSSSTSLEADMMIYEDDISLDSKGTGRQVFIKTDFALKRSGTDNDVVLMEEPENHLSPTKLRELINIVASTQSGQLFITTHSSFISTRLELQNLFMMYEDVDGSPLSLHDLREATAKYFMKAPVAGIIEFALSNKIILVEGPSEYMLFDKFYLSIAGNKPEKDGVNIIDVRGLSFKRYLEIARLLHSRVAVVTDNDGDKQHNCIDKYSDFVNDDNIKIFYDMDNAKSTFEIILYEDNMALCDELFGANGSARDYMLRNKTEAAFKLLEQDDAINTPEYIKRAIEWIQTSE